MIHLYCGDGKGKTTAAMGLALRAAGSGMRVVVVQFLKDGSSGEVRMLAALPNVTVLAGKVCKAFAWKMTKEQKDATLLLHTENLQRALELPCDMLVLDEACSAVSTGLIDEAVVNELLSLNPDSRELVLTGRDPTEYMLSRADYVTEMVKRKHPFDSGVQAREGIEF